VLYDLAEGKRSAGEAALYATPNNPVDFAQQIAKLLDSESLRKELGTIGKQRIYEGGLNWGIEQVTLLKAYQAALQKEESSLPVEKAVCEEHPGAAKGEQPSC
jgi:glycosyltransferase involved in cell wall biosynthesis